MLFCLFLERVVEVVRLILFVCLFINIFSFSFLFVEHLVAHLQNVVCFLERVVELVRLILFVCLSICSPFLSCL